MSQLNVRRPQLRTAEGAPAPHISPLQELRRLVMACMLWEDNFYVDGKTIAQRIGELVHQVSLAQASEMALEARNAMKLRHVPLLIVRYMANHPNRKSVHPSTKGLNDTRLISQTLCDVIQRPDELAEFVSIYWKDGKQPLSKQVKKGLAKAFQKFDEYALAKYNRDRTVKLRDVLFLCHSKPADVLEAAGPFTKNARKAMKDQPGSAAEKRILAMTGRPEGLTDGEKLYLKLVDNKLETPDTWEVELSASGNNKDSWLRLLNENKLGDLAFLRNLRNMTQAGIEPSALAVYGERRSWGRVLPFRFISAARMVPQLEPMLEGWMFKCLRGSDRLRGRTILLCDVSSSMGSRLSMKSDLTRQDAMKALAMLLREICEEVVIVPFARAPLGAVPPRRGFALADIIERGRQPDGTHVGDAVRWALSQVHDRLIVITDEQSADRVPQPVRPCSYMLNVASHQNGVGYGGWVHIDGWSEAIVDYIKQYEG